MTYSPAENNKQNKMKLNKSIKRKLKHQSVVQLQAMTKVLIASQKKHLIRNHVMKMKVTKIVILIQTTMSKILKKKVMKIPSVKNMFSK